MTKNLDVKVRCTEDDRVKVEALAKHFDRNVSDTVRQLIRTAYTTMTHLAGFKPEVPSATVVEGHRDWPGLDGTPVVWPLKHHTAEQAAALMGEAAPVALTNIEDLFNALCTYQRDARFAGISKDAHTKARETFKLAIGPLANHIDWTDRS